MIARFAYLSQHPDVFPSLTGLRVAEFEALAADLLPRFAAAEHQRLDRPNRQRAIGGGRAFGLAPRDQLLCSVVWLRQYPTYPVLAYLFGRDDATVRRYVVRWLPLLEAAGLETMRLPDPGRQRGKPLDALLTDLPAVAVLIDTFEQRIQRPKDRTVADRYVRHEVACCEWCMRVHPGSCPQPVPAPMNKVLGGMSKRALGK
jgi:hypothetical protein